MSAKPELTTMTRIELRAYVLEHREDNEALHLYLDKAHTDNPNPRIYSPEENVSNAVAEYMENLGQPKN